MTTAHRATFTHAKAKDTSLSQTYQASITHKRFLPAHTQLKYRVNSQQKQRNGLKNDSQIEEEPEEDRLFKLKENLLKKESQHLSQIGLTPSNQDNDYNKRRIKLLEDTKDIDNDSDSDQENIVFGDGGKQPIPDIKAENNNNIDDSGATDSDSASDSHSASDDGSESESEDETEQLMLELAKIKNERQKLEQQKKDISIEQEAMKSNPLVNLLVDDDQSGAAAAPDGELGAAPKRGWRSTTLFSNKRQKITSNNDTVSISVRPNDNYVNDMLHSDFHRRFLDKYVR